MLRSKRWIAAGCGLAFLMSVLAAMGASDGKKDKKKDRDPYLKPDESWISIGGKVTDTEADAFTLDYGDGTITVEMDDWDWYEEDGEVLDGDKVRVYGEIDDDLYETTKIEASSVYVENRGAYYFASSADEENDDDYDYWVDYDPIVVGETTARGTITSIDDREFTINTGARKLAVDTAAMSYNPMDDEGYQTLDVGDYVSVSGDMDDDFWEQRELMADVIITLEND